MRISKDGHSLHLEVGFRLRKKEGSIHMGSNDPDVSDFNVTVNNEPSSPNGHPTLYRRLAAFLRQMDAPAPELEKQCGICLKDQRARSVLLM
jgi:hypothetical protein